MDTMYFINNYLNSYEITYEKIKNDLSIYIKTDLNIKKDYIYDEYLKQCVMKNFKKDHRIFMMTCVAALTLGGEFEIYDKDSINTSFPNFLKLLKKLGAKLN